MLEPSKIYEDIESHPPLMQEEAQRKYIGQEIEWSLTFTGGYVHDGMCHLRFRSGPRLSAPNGGVRCAVPLSRYSWLKTMQAETPVQVRGRIREINVLAIELDALELSLSESAIVK